MKRLPTPLPRGLNVPVLLVVGLAVVLSVTDGDPLTGLGLLVLVGLVVGPLVLGARAVRSRRRRQRASAHGFGPYRAKVTDTSDLADLLGGDRWWSFLLDTAVLDLTVDTSRGLVLAPTRGTRWFGYRAATLRWDEIAAVSTDQDTFEVAGKISLTSLTELSLVVVGTRVPHLYEPMTAEDLYDGFTPEQLAAENAEMLASLREQHGPGFVWRTLPVRLLVEDGAELAELVRRYRRGVLPG